MLRFLDLRLPDEPGFDLFPEAVRVALDVNGGGVMQGPVQDGRGDYGAGSFLRTRGWYLTGSMS